MGLKAYGATLKEAFENAAYGMFDLMVALDETAQTTQIDVSVDADDTESLLVAFLNELLFIFDTERLALGRFDIVDWDEKTRLRAHAWGGPLDHQERREQIKAVTYHNIRVERRPDETEVEILFDV